MARFDELDNQQGLGEQPTSEINEGYGDSLAPSNDEYVQLIRQEALAAGVRLPASDEDVKRFAARAAFEAQ